MPSNSPSRATKYATLAEELRGQISRGALLPGDRLPSLNELCVRHELAIGTVDRALQILEKDGLIVRVNGSGIFVAEPTAREDSRVEKPLLGLVLPICHGNFFSPIVEAVQRESRAAGYHLLLASSWDDEELEAQLLEQFADQTMGLCVVPCGSGNQAAFARLLESRKPFVLMDLQVDGLDVSLVATDNERGGYLATRHLLEAGCRTVYTIGENALRASTLRDRIGGFRRALLEAGVPFDSSLVRQADGDAAHLGYVLTRELLAELFPAGKSNVPESPIGLFTLNEHVTPGCYMAIKERGLRIPQDVAVVGFDDATAIIFDPPLTAVRQDLTGMGREAVHRLLEHIRLGGNARPRTVRLQPDLVVRNSSDPKSEFCGVRNLEQSPRWIGAQRAELSASASV